MSIGNHLEQSINTMTQVLALALLAGALFGSGCGGRTAPIRMSGLSEAEKHQLYSAALAANESPLETEAFKVVCERIGIFDVHGRPNNNYLGFVSAHVDWAMKEETQQFKADINSREKAREYIAQHLPRQ